MLIPLSPPPADSIWQARSFNLGTAGAKIFSGTAKEEFGYTVQQVENNQGKWLLVGAPWSGYSQNRKGDIYKCPITGSKNSCDKLNLQDSVNVPEVKNVNANMSLGLTLTRTPGDNGLTTCGPLWGQQCGTQNFYPGVCAKLDPVFRPQPAFSPAVQKCGGPMDIVIVLDASNSIFPWEPIVEFLKNLLPALDIGPQSTQVGVIQYAVNPKFEFKLNQYQNNKDAISAASNIKQMYGEMTNTFQAIEFASTAGFSAQNGGRPNAAKVMVVVTDGESHDSSMTKAVIADCEKKGITRFGIAVLGYYTRNNIDTEKLISEIKSIASSPTEKHFFNVSEEAVLYTIKIMPFPDVLMLGAVGAYAWSGTVVHQTGSQVHILPLSAFEDSLQDKNHSSLLGYSVTTMRVGPNEYFVAGAPRSNHSGQVIVYTVDAQKQSHIIDSQRGKQIGSYFGSVLCSLDVDKDGTTDFLLVGAPMYMSELKREQGRVFLFSVTKGILNEKGFLKGPPPTMDARFGMAISAIPDLDLDGFNDVVVGAPLEEKEKGVIYIYNGKRDMSGVDFSQRILGFSLDPQLKYFGRSLDSYKDLNGDELPDISVGAYGKVVQLWSRKVASVTVKASFNPDKINIFNKPCNINGRMLSCFDTKLCFTAAFRPTNQITKAEVVDITYNLTLDADLLSSRVTSRGMFVKNNERLLKDVKQVPSTGLCQDYKVYVQETPDFDNSLSLKVEIEQADPNANPVLDKFSENAYQFFIPFTKDCGSDEVCNSDLVLSVKTDAKTSGSAPILVSPNSRELSFEVVVKNKKENAYNTQLVITFSKNLYYSSIFPLTEDVKCTSQTEKVICHVGYPVLRENQEVKEIDTDNEVDFSFPVQYDTGISLSKHPNINFFVADATTPVLTVKTYDDIGPEYNFKVSTSYLPVSLLYLTINLPMTSKGGNRLLYITSVEEQTVISCQHNLVNPLKIGENTQTVSFSAESFRGMEKLDCKSANCESIKCILKDTKVKSTYFVNVKTRIWNSTFISVNIFTSILERWSAFIIITFLKQGNDVSFSKPGETADVPVGVIAGSVIAGLFLLALAVALLWKVCFCLFACFLLRCRGTTVGYVKLRMMYICKMSISSLLHPAAMNRYG
uniref:Integrin subunit alpha 2 n=1 Tax=Pundamilia nyererei TaxID=303518 RepID=A0A3B4FAV6_9CICH